MIEKLKKWNWSAFWVILAIAFVGSLSNKTTDTILEVIILTLMVGLPMGILWAWISGD